MLILTTGISFLFIELYKFIFLILCQIIVLINIILLIALLRIYRRNHAEVKSKYTMGLIFFTLVFILQNLIMLFSFWISGSMSIFAFLELIALAILYKISR